jgi:hypothetical protein
MENAIIHLNGERYGPLNQHTHACCQGAVERRLRPVPSVNGDVGFMESLAHGCRCTEYAMLPPFLVDIQGDGSYDDHLQGERSRETAGTGDTAGDLPAVCGQWPPP